MGRLTAWIASRRKSLRSSRAHAESRRASRSLRYERYEERIALSTNAVVGDADWAAFWSNVSVDRNYLLDANAAAQVAEGGWINLGDSQVQWHLTNGAGFAAYDSQVAGLRATSAFNGVSAFNGAADFDRPSPLYVSDFLDVSGLVIKMDSGADFSGAFGDTMTTESRIVPIAPPMSGRGGNEGGQIAMTPFVGPAALGLPSAGESHYATKNAHTLQPEHLDAASKVPTSTPDESLRGRAVVYEVAHVENRFGESADRADAARAYDEQDGRSIESPISQQAATRSSTNGDGRVASAADKSRGEAVADQSARRSATAMKVIETQLSQKDAANVEIDRKTALNAASEAGVAAAHDGAFEQWQSEAEPVREAAAVTADNHQRRALGAALLVLGAVPVTKALWRRGQQESAEEHPPQRRSAL